MIHPHLPEFIGGMGVPQGDGVHAVLQHPRGDFPVGGLVDRPDSAAVHDHLVAAHFGGGDGEEIKPQGAVTGHILHQGAAAVDIKAGLTHYAQKSEDIEGVNGVHPVVETGLIGVAREHP
ncbi:hypothetical protein SDC9_203190 [bioreactor metagenome]|uniref:Uncharacterized protein n=1 Tax=bioreactor metagenome TaxID=1076179 RepID=A0A645IWD7_9ZZZZ